MSLLYDEEEEEVVAEEEPEEGLLDLINAAHLQIQAEQQPTRDAELADRSGAPPHESAMAEADEASLPLGDEVRERGRPPARAPGLAEGTAASRSSTPTESMNAGSRESTPAGGRTTSTRGSTPAREGTPKRDRERSLVNEDQFKVSTTGSPSKKQMREQDAPRGLLALSKADKGVQGEYFSLVWRRPKLGLPTEDMEVDVEMLGRVELDLAQIHARVALIRTGVQEQTRRILQNQNEALQRELQAQTAAVANSEREATRVADHLAGLAAERDELQAANEQATSSHAEALGTLQASHAETLREVEARLDGAQAETRADLVAMTTRCHKAERDVRDRDGQSPHTSLALTPASGATQMMAPPPTPKTPAARKRAQDREALLEMQRQVRATEANVQLMLQQHADESEEEEEASEASPRIEATPGPSSAAAAAPIESLCRTPPPA